MQINLCDKVITIRALSSKTFLVMKLTVFLLTAACLQLSATGFSQSISLSGNSMRLEKVFSAIEKQSGYFFFYKYKDVQNAIPVDLDLRNVPLRQALELTFQNQPLTYSIEDKTIIVSKKSKSQPPVTVRGKVTDEKGEPLAGASVLIKGSNLGTSTDGQGNYQITINSDATLIFSLVGFKDQEVPAEGRTVINVTLREQSVDLNEVVVVGYNQVERQHIASSISQMDMESVKTVRYSNSRMLSAGPFQGPR